MNLNDFVVLPNKPKSVKLNVRKLRELRMETIQLDQENQDMENRLKELREIMSREKEEREKSGALRWKSAQANSGTRSKEKGGKLSAGKMKIRVLKDESLPEVHRPSEKVPGPPPRDPGHSRKPRLKGKVCGQCEARTAGLVCAECGEDYCVGCFARFHQKGALKHHRMIPVQVELQTAVSSLDVLSRFQKQIGEMKETSNLSTHSAALSPATEKTQHPAHTPAGYQDTQTHSTQILFVNEGEEVDGDDDEGSLLSGCFDEEASSRSFQQALNEWRERKPAGDLMEEREPHQPNQQSPVMVDVMATQAGETFQQPIHIEFREDSLSYMERLLLKKHRRTPIESSRPLPARSTSPQDLLARSATPPAEELTVEEMDLHKYCVSLFAVPGPAGGRRPDKTSKSRPSITEIDEVNLSGSDRALRGRRANHSRAGAAEISAISKAVGDSPAFSCSGVKQGDDKQKLNQESEDSFSTSEEEVSCPTKPPTSSYSWLVPPLDRTGSQSPEPFPTSPPSDRFSHYSLSSDQQVEHKLQRTPSPRLGDLSKPQTSAPPMPKFIFTEPTLSSSPVFSQNNWNQDHPEAQNRKSFLLPPTNCPSPVFSHPSGPVLHPVSPKGHHSSSEVTALSAGSLMHKLHSPTSNPRPVVLKPTSDSPTSSPRPAVLNSSLDSPTNSPRPAYLKPTSDFSTTSPRPVDFKSASDSPITSPRPGVLKSTSDFPTASPRPVVLKSTSDSLATSPSPGVLKSTSNSPTTSPRPVVLMSTSDSPTTSPRPVVLKSTSNSLTTSPRPIVFKSTSDSPTTSPRPVVLKSTSNSPTTSPRPVVLKSASNSPTTSPRPGVLKPTSDSPTTSPRPVVLKSSSNSPTTTPRPLVFRSTSDSPTTSPRPGVLMSNSDSPTTSPRPVVLKSTSDSSTNSPRPVVLKSTSNSPTTSPRPGVLMSNSDSPTTSPRPVVLKSTSDFPTTSPRPVVLKSTSNSPTTSPRPVVLKSTSNSPTNSPRPVVLKSTSNSPTNSPRPASSLSQCVSSEPQVAEVALSFQSLEEDSLAFSDYVHPSSNSATDLQRSRPPPSSPLSPQLSLSDSDSLSESLDLMPGDEDSSDEEMKGCADGEQKEEEEGEGSPGPLHPSLSPTGDPPLSLRDSLQESPPSGLFTEPGQALISLAQQTASEFQQYQGLEGFLTLGLDPSCVQPSPAPPHTPTERLTHSQELMIVGQGRWRPASSVRHYAEEELVAAVITSSRSATPISSAASLRRPDQPGFSSRITPSFSRPNTADPAETPPLRPLSRAAVEILEVQSVERPELIDSEDEDDEDDQALAGLEEELRQISAEPCVRK